MTTEHSSKRDQRSAADTRDTIEVRVLEEEHSGNGHGHRAEIVRLRKPVMFREDGGRKVDGRMVSPQYYDCFNYALLAGTGQEVNVAVGISSANPGEGKTLVASNLAVSLTVAFQRKTVLVDLNVRNPRLHEVFDVAIGPGLLEAVAGGPIHVAPTAVTDLYVLTAGTANSRIGGGMRLAMGEEQEIEPSLELEQVAAFRDVLYSLKEEFNFVIVDMPAVREHLVPLLFTNQLDGVLFVVHGGHTKQAELEQALQLVNERRVLGFVYNGSDRPRPRRRKGR